MGRQKYLGMTREGYKAEMYSQVHTYLAQGLNYKQAIKRVGTTDRVFRAGRDLFHKAHPQTPAKAYKTPGRREYTLKAPRPRKGPEMVFKTAPPTRAPPPPPAPGTDPLMTVYEKKRESVEKWFKKQDTQFIKDRGQLKLFLDQKFNPAFSRIVYEHYKNGYDPAT